MKWNKRNLLMECMHFTNESYCKFTHDGYNVLNIQVEFIKK